MRGEIEHEEASCRSPVLRNRGSYLDAMARKAELAKEKERRRETERERKEKERGEKERTERERYVHQETVAPVQDSGDVGRGRRGEGSHIAQNLDSPRAAVSPQTANTALGAPAASPRLSPIEGGKGHAGYGNHDHGSATDVADEPIAPHHAYGAPHAPDVRSDVADVAEDEEASERVAEARGEGGEGRRSPDRDYPECLRSPKRQGGVQGWGLVEARNFNDASRTNGPGKATETDAAPAPGNIEQEAGKGSGRRGGRGGYAASEASSAISGTTRKDRRQAGVLFGAPDVPELVGVSKVGDRGAEGPLVKVRS